jgi:spore coat protein CotH
MKPHRWRELLLIFSAVLGWVYATAEGVSESKLPVLDLRSLQEIQSTTKAPCLVGWMPTNASAGGLGDTNTVGTLKAQVKFHGASSQAYEKKSFALSLDAPTPWLGLHSGRQWVLNAAYIDCSMMRHKLSYDLFQSLASPENKRPASSSRFVEVMLNGHYHGAYLLMERVDGSLLGFAPKGRPSKIPGVIYKAIDHEANFRQSGHTGYEQREPNPEERELWTPLDELNQFVSESFYSLEVFEMFHTSLLVFYLIDNA